MGITTITPIKIKWVKNEKITILDKDDRITHTSVEPGQINEVVIVRIMMDNGNEMIDMEFEDCFARSVPREYFRVVLEEFKTKNPGE